MPDNDSPDSSSQADFNIANHLPLRLIKSEVIPPAPNRTNSPSEPAIDWLYDFAGYTWIAYGAASLLVISHFPNPLSESEILIGPIFRQVLELSIDGCGIVSAVSWSPVTPSVGDLAAALDNCIGLFSYNPDISCDSSFCWSQNATLVQSTKVEVIKWTSSGDGIIAGGTEVVLWRKMEKSWERAWKFKPAVPHILISAGWSIEGLLATAPLGKLQVGNLSFPINEPCMHVLVTGSHGDPKYVQAELRHPSPISMIQWRPLTGRSLSKDAIHLQRSVLLTSCLDGAIRLWSENDDGKVKKHGRDGYDHKTIRLSFQIIAVLEVNQALNGSLGSNIHVVWAGELDCIANIGSHYCSSTCYQCDRTGCCEWLIGIGPQFTVTLWAIHCLDDFSPVRFPRVTLWKRQELSNEEMGCRGLLLNKAFIRRNRMFSPPTTCSLVELLPCNSLAWLHLDFEGSPNAQERSSTKFHNEKLVSSQALGILDIDSHKGNILKVVVHPYLFELGLAASLDANGVLLFWSLNTASNGIAGFPTLNPSSKFSGESEFSKSHVKYTSLGWAPAVLNEDRVLVMGHAGGIDCFVVKVLENEGEKIAYHHLCTISFGSQDVDQGPTTLCTIPLPSSCNKTFISNSFMLLAAWKSNFQAFSWKLTLHHYSPGSSFDCGCDIKKTANYNLWTFESDFSDKRYCLSVYPFSSIFPAPFRKDMISSFAVVQPTNDFSPQEQDWSSTDETSYSISPYHIVTGCNDGTVKLWRSMPADLSHSHAEWNLVGELAAHQGPVLAISPSACGGKIATVSSAGHLSSFSTLHIWESVHLGSEGKFILEDAISFDSKVVVLNWLMLGNGLPLLGVCLQNELKIYAQRRCGGQDSLKLEEPVEGNIWACIAVTHTHAVIHDFFWGPNATVGIVHLEYFCVFTHLSLWATKNLPLCCPETGKDVLFICNGGSNKFSLPGVFFDSDSYDAKESSLQDLHKHFQSRLSMNASSRDNFISPLDVKRGKHFGFDTGVGFWSFSVVAEMLGGPLPAFHPEALLLNIGAGNWKRAYVALHHLVDYLASARISGKRYSFRKDNHVIPQVPLSNYLEGHLSSYSGEKSFQWDGSIDGITSSSQFQKGAFTFASWGNSDSNNASPSSSIRSEPRDFVEVLDKHYDSVGISNSGKIQILAIIDILQELSNPHSASAYGSLDEPGRRFWVAVRFQRLFFTKRYGRSPLARESVVSSALIGWAFHSDCQENLFNSLLSNEPSWQEMHDYGVGFWYSNTAQLRVKMEKLARQQYLKTKDPKNCALLYIALNRIQVLVGLFKISKDEKDKPLVAFLSRNFQEEKNKAAALKNAYVLMGKHQLELATAFFLLGGDMYSAVNVCAKNLGDEQLALVICRLVDGYSGPLEHHLISKFILPSSLLRGDYWLASLLEWILGNYSKAYLRMLGFRMNNNEVAISTCQKSFLDPSIGQYCLMLANKTNMKNAIGEKKALDFSRWAIWMSTVALSRSGFPLEALECLSSCLNAFGASSQGTILGDGDVEFLNEAMKLSPNGNSSNWISGDLAKQKELNAKSEFAMHYVSQLLKEHPSWRHINMVLFGGCMYSEPENEEHRRSIEKFIGKITATLVYFQQKFSLDLFNLMVKIMIYLYSHGLPFIGYHMLAACVPRIFSPQEDYRCDRFLSSHILPNLLSRASGEISIVSRYVVSCIMNCSCLTSFPTENIMAPESRSWRSVAWQFYRHNLILSLWCLRATLKLFFGSFTEDFLFIPFRVLDVAEYYVYFASAWSQMDLRVLALITKPVLHRFTQGHTPHDIIEDLNEILSEIRKIEAHELSFNNVGAFEVDEDMQHEQAGHILAKVPKDERWLVISFSLWGQISSFLQPLLSLLTEKIEANCSIQYSRELSTMSSLSVFGADSNDVQLPTALWPFSKLLYVTCSHISVYCAKQLVSYLLPKGDGRVAYSFLSSVDDHSDPFSSPSHIRQRSDKNILKNEAELRADEIFWRICSDPNIIPGFIIGNLKWFECLKKKSFRGWSDVYMSILRECEGGETGHEEDRIGSPREAVGSPVACLTPNDHPFLSSGGENMKKVVPFDSPKEIYKRTGELLEALCINSIDQHQAALATNRKGITYFNWEDGLPGWGGSEYIWADADWPHNGWAGSESTPVPTCVYPGVGLGSRKGTHLGLGGATIGAGLKARAARELMNGGTYGVPGYPGMGASSLGWGIQEDFEQFIDPIPTIGNVNASSFSTHPSMPLFLVGSSNTHVYLWEFGKDRATATYGVLPAANVPPPYALASISAVRFDQCGHRFVTGALDGTVCTWQLEVGGRSNVGPTESSICFDNHTSDVTYVTPSGSIIAAAGYSSSGINVVIWDTLAPIATSRASIMCHEGGTRSLSVFDNNLGSGSVSPLIVTGGKAGDVGLHDFRYIATGRTKKHKHNDSSDPHGNMASTAEMQSKTGDQNRNGMLWYIPKAHIGSVTKVSTIPNTSFFLTGSKDGDVKLWDAKRARLVYHWPRLHERHTFLQPSSRGFGGVVRAAVTDIQVFSHGFLTCGGDGTVKLIQLKDFAHL